jgi:Protein of unknown function (DUF3551)
MKVIQKNMMMAALIASSAFAFVALPSPAAQAGPIVPPGHACLQSDEGGTDCSFTSYGECLASASGIGAECYGTTASNDADDPRTHGAWHGYGYRAQ